MSLSRASLIERAWLRNQSGPGAGIPLSRYDAMEPQARVVLARQIASSPDQSMRGLLRKDFTLTVTSGVASLTTPLTASEPMLLEALRYARITSAESVQPWQYLPDYSTLSLDRETFGMVHWCLVGSNLIAKDTDDALDALSTTATANSSFVPLASTLSGNLDLEEMAVAILSEMMIGAPVAAGK